MRRRWKAWRGSAAASPWLCPINLPVEHPSSCPKAMLSGDAGVGDALQGTTAGGGGVGFCWVTLPALWDPHWNPLHVPSILHCCTTSGVPVCSHGPSRFPGIPAGCHGLPSLSPASPHPQVTTMIWTTPVMTVMRRRCGHISAAWPSSPH